jgi:hypothetical protein
MYVCMCVCVYVFVYACMCVYMALGSPDDVTKTLYRSLADPSDTYATCPFVCA